jgi:hypothetical protein
LKNVICKDEDDFNAKMILYIAGTEKAFIPQKPDLIDKESLEEAAEAAKEDSALFLVPSVISPFSIFNKTFKPYILLMSNKKMFMFPYNGEAFPDIDKKGK